MKIFFYVMIIIKSVTLLANESGSSLNERTYNEAHNISPFYSQNSLNSTKNNCTLTSTLHNEATGPNREQLEKTEINQNQNTTHTDTENQTALTDNDNICSYLCCCCIKVCNAKDSSVVKSCNPSSVKEIK